MHFRCAPSFLWLVTSAALAHPSPRQSLWTGNKAGAFFVEQDNTFNNIDATISIPNIQSGQPQTTLSVWVGFDTFTCATSLKVGVFLNINDDGTHSYAGFSQLLPQGPVTVYYNLTISPGDTIELHITANSSTSSSISIRNINNGLTALEAFGLYAPHTLCRQDVEWIVEALTDPMPDFGQVHFQNATVQGSGGKKLMPSDGANVLEIEQDDRTMTITDAGGSDIYVTYAST